MKLTTKQLKQIILEELNSFLDEGHAADFLKNYKALPADTPKAWDPETEQKFAALEAEGGVASKKENITQRLAFTLRHLERNLDNPEAGELFLKGKNLALKPEDGEYSVKARTLQWSASVGRFFFWTNWNENRESWGPIKFQW